MSRKIGYAMVLWLLAGALAVSTVEAQSKRAEDTAYLKARVGLTGYSGDYADLNMAFPALGGEVGYQLTPMFGLGATFLWGQYPKAEHPGIDDEARYTWQLLLNYLPFPAATLSPYFLVGGQLVSGGPSNQVGVGPALGVGLDYVLSHHLSVFAEAHSNLSFPDEAADNQDADTGFDALHFLGLGLRYTFGSAFTEVSIDSIAGPDTLVTDEEGIFTATVNAEEATRPLEYRWEFDDGTTAEGLSARHSYAEPGTYDVSFTVENPKSSAEEDVEVTVIAPPEIVSMQADPEAPETGESVEFSAEVQGTEPLDYQWEFGDGETAADESPSHAYQDPGTYTVDLEVTNQAGTTNNSLQLRVEPAIPEVCRQLTELNTVHFGFDQAQLEEEAQGLLRENIDVLNECPMVNVRIEGYADQAGADQYNLRLSEQRAQAVEQFYTEEGIESGRLTAEGLGEAPQPCLKEDPGPGCERNRRVESVPTSLPEE